MELPSGKVVFNENKIKMLNYTTKDFQNATYHDFMKLVHPDDYDQTMQAMKDHLEGKKPFYEIEYRIKTKHGQYKWFYDRGAIVEKNKEKHTIVVKGIVYDITDRKNAELTLQNHKKELEKVVRERTKNLKEINIHLKNEINDRKKAEEYTKQTKEYLRDIINSASEFIITVDMTQRISSWNKTAERITGYKTIQVINRSISKLEVFNNPQEIKTLIKQTCKNLQPRNENIIIKNKDQQKKILSVSISPIEGINKECQGTVFVGRDITYEQELHGKLLPGSSYYIPDNQQKPSLTLLSSITRQGTPGLYITRSTPNVINTKLESIKNISTYILSQTQYKEYPTIKDLPQLIDIITQFCIKNTECIILIDGIHYLLIKFSFEQLIETLFQLNDYIGKEHGILLVRVDPSTLKQHEQAVIENELQLLPSRKIDDLTLDDDVYAILKYIYQENEMNSIVSYRKVMQAFKIAYATAANRLKKLNSEGLIITKREGKHRTIYVTDKGKNIIHSRQSI